MVTFNQTLFLEPFASPTSFFCPVQRAMADILSVVQFLEQEGFALDHPTEDKVIPKSEVEAFLYQSYLNRQIQVDRVRKIVSDKQ